MTAFLCLVALPFAWATSSPFSDFDVRLGYNPVADPAAVVISGNARFTVLTERLFRVEYAPFEDRPTIAVVNRRLPVPKFAASTTAGLLSITTSAVVLRYAVGLRFSPTTLSISELPSASSAPATWAFGDTNSGAGKNLLGTVRSLDLVDWTQPLNCTVIDERGQREHDEQMHCAWGVVGRSGWALLDETGAVLMGTASGGTQGWFQTGAAGRSVATIDQYIFLHGTGGSTSRSVATTFAAAAAVPSVAAAARLWADVRATATSTAFLDAVAALRAISGAPQLPPRSAYGVWWSRWFNMNQEDTYYLVDSYVTRGVPLDVYVYDMDWHTKPYWGGYQWDTRLFPSPVDDLAWIRQFGLPVMASAHDNDGVRASEPSHDALARYMGLALNVSTRKKAAAGGKPALSAIDKLLGLGPRSGDGASSGGDGGSEVGDIPFSPLNALYMRGLDDVTMVQFMNVDAIWIDWQQGGTAGGLPDGQLNPTIVTNHVRSTSSMRRKDNVRAFILARFGGLGSHRYPVGFSGDVSDLTWPNLAYQPYYSATAANALFGQWSHDIIGPYPQPDLYTRWVQTGSVSAIMRSHDRGLSGGGCALHPGVASSVGGSSVGVGSEGQCPYIHPWDVPTVYYESMRAALRDRVELVPYIATAWALYHASGLSPVFPLYLMHPEDDYAYAAAPAISRGSSGSGPPVLNAHYFGPSMVVAPVVVQGDPSTEYLLTLASVLLPGAGRSGGADVVWVDVEAGRWLRGPVNVTRQWDISEIPRFVRAGSAIPAATLPFAGPGVIATTRSLPDPLEFRVYLGSGGAAIGRLIEDDGLSLEYLSGAHVETIISVTAAAPSAYRRPVTATAGVAAVNVTLSYTFGPQPVRGYPTSRRVLLSFPAGPPIQSTSSLPFARYGCLGVDRGAGGALPSSTTVGCWWYDGLDATLRVLTPVIPVGPSQTYSVVLAAAAPFVFPGDDIFNDPRPKPASAAAAAAAGVTAVNLRGRFRHAVVAKRLQDATRMTQGAHDPGPAYVVAAAVAPTLMSRLAGTDPAAAAKVVQDYDACWASAIEESLRLYVDAEAPITARAATLFTSLS